ncbi:uncharacterized protein LOC125501750 [Athalia rosae]|uniref:uncharacterized protein LOC125501750 n=1 Tax=Athalia rosae TaxID=37344 RepID=UPI002033CD3E|nr:uncharacterized protein LOC125501750 [Athalia rosae]
MTALGYHVTEMWECVFDRLLKNNAEMRAYIASHSTNSRTESLNPRDAFYGGRTGNTSCYHEVKTDADGVATEQIRYVDVCSLYPYVRKSGRYPVGHPVVYVGDECRMLTGMGGTDIARVEGLVKCTVLPPQNLYHPVLPVRMHEKLMFALCRTCCENLEQNGCRHSEEKQREFEGTWVSDELRKAVEKGYRILNILEIWQFQITSFDSSTRQGGHFTQYIDTFLKIKQEASGWPADCKDEASRNDYLDEYERVEGIRRDRSRISKNPGLRSVSKLCLNSFSGKFRQQENMTKTEIVNTRQQLLELITNPEVVISGILIVNDTVLYVNWSHAAQSVEPSPLSNVVIAAYTTAQARLKLYEYLELLDRRVLYYDTDSVIYRRNMLDPNEYEPPTGNFLGDLTDELEAHSRVCFGGCEILRVYGTAP